jgi:ATP-dependent helicase Lhr and Lhr-like helicase
MRMMSEDLVGTIFPDQVACAENLVGEREVPDHPLVAQTISDCLHEAMDIDGLERLLADIECGKIRIVARDLTEPSPLAREVLTARPYAFLDDAPLEERRTQAVMSRRWLDPDSADEIGRLDEGAIARVREEAWPDAANADELQDALVWFGFLTEAEADARENWKEWLIQLAQSRRVALFTAPQAMFWIPAERLRQVEAVYPGAVVEPAIAAPASADQVWEPNAALIELVRGRLEGQGPATLAQLAGTFGLPPERISAALTALEVEGFALAGSFTPGGSEREWCERRLLARIHRYTVKRLRAEIEPVSARDYLRFLFNWQGVSTDTRREGAQALDAVIEQLAGFEAPAAAWESAILPARLSDYEPSLLDNACLSGRVSWARLGAPAVKPKSSGRRPAPLKSTPISLFPRKTASVWARLIADEPPHVSARAAKVAEFIRKNGASFFDEIVEGTHLLRTQVEEALAELVAAGQVISDSFAGLRALLAAPRHHRRRQNGARLAHAGRWALANRKSAKSDHTQRVEQIALVLLRRYGIVFMCMLEREASWLPRWRELLRVCRKLEARGEIRGGRFVSGFSGEQFALPEAIAALRSIRRRPADDSLVSVSGADSLNLAGILTPGPKLAALAGNRVLYRDGMPIAFLEGDSARFLEAVEPEIENRARLALYGHAEPATHLPRIRRLSQLEAARAAEKSRRPAVVDGSPPDI